MSLQPQRFGDRAVFAVEVGEVVSPGVRAVDLWAAGKHLTADDNLVFLPYFRRRLAEAVDQLRTRGLPPSPYPGRSPEEVFRRLHADENGLRERFWFLDWGETLDNVSGYAYLDGEFVIAFAFWRHGSEVFAVRVAPGDLIAVLAAAAEAIRSD